MRRMYSKEQLIKLIQDYSSGGGGENATVVPATDFTSEFVSPTTKGAAKFTETSAIISFNIYDATGSTVLWGWNVGDTVDILNIPVPEQYQTIIANSSLFFSSGYIIAPAILFYDTQYYNVMYKIYYLNGVLKFSVIIDSVIANFVKNKPTALSGTFSLVFEEGE